MTAGPARNSRVDEKYPQWIRLRSNDYDTPAGRYILAGGSTTDWANYGRWCVLRQILATTPYALMDVSNPRQLGSLARQLGFSGPKACRSWLVALAECDAIDREALEERGWVLVGDISDALQAYQEMCRTNRRNKVGRSVGTSNEPTDGPSDEPSVDS